MLKITWLQEYKSLVKKATMILKTHFISKHGGKRYLRPRNMAKEGGVPELAPESCDPVPVTCVISYSIT